jgi:hypothetical protein
MNISISTYCHNTNAGNAKVVTIGPLSVYFSYQTIVAFRHPTSHMLYVRENNWGPTTGKHINAIDGGNKGERIPSDKFEEMCDIIVASISVWNLNGVWNKNDE